MTASTQRPGALKRLGLWIKRTATFVYGPAEMPEDVDPIKQIDRELGNDTAPKKAPPHRSERQKSYDNLPRGHE